VFSESADLYDAFYREKDYRAEAAYVAVLVRAHVPSAESVLDVACGTGQHARVLSRDHGFRVDGVDIDPRFAALATEKNPAGTFSCADMTDLDLGHTYDAVLCLFSSIGYVRHVGNLRRAIGAMARHVAKPGILVVEPWFEPDTMEDGYVTTTTVDIPGGKACRMTHTSVDGRLSRLRFEYLIGTTAGLRRASEIHELGLFTRTEMREAFETAGLTVNFDPEGPTGRGLYVAVRSA
jgi:SAM-dependent methyltransferase